MTNKRLCLPDGNDKNKEGEDNQENASPTTFVMYSNAERCPICLNCLLEQEVGSPENCHHVFCITCILKWAQVVPFCPVDRKPFQAVYRLEDNVKFQVPQIVKTLEKEGVACKNSSCCTVECPFAIRNTGGGPIDVKNINSYEKHSSCIENKKKASKPRRPLCLRRCIRSDFNHMHSSGDIARDSAGSCTNHSPEFSEFHDINLAVHKKRQALRSLWSSAMQLCIDGTSCRAGDIHTDLPQMTSVLPSFSAIRPPRETWEFSSTAHIVTHAQDGVEKKKAGASNPRGARKKPESTPTRRRSARNSRSDSTSQASSPPMSSNSGSNANDCQDSSLNALSADSEKPLKHSSKKETKKELPRKKSLRSSVCEPEESSASEMAEEDITAESDHDPKSPSQERNLQSDSQQSHESENEMSDDQRPHTLQKKQTDVRKTPNSPAASKVHCSDIEISSASENEKVSDIVPLPGSPASGKEQMSCNENSPACLPAKVNLSENECVPIARTKLDFEHMSHSPQSENQKHLREEHSVAASSSETQQSALEPSPVQASDEKEKLVQSFSPSKEGTQADNEPSLATETKPLLDTTFDTPSSATKIKGQPEQSSENEDKSIRPLVLEKELSDLEQSPAPPSLEKEPQSDNETLSISSASCKVLQAEHTPGSPLLEKEHSDVEYLKESKKEQPLDCELSPPPPALEKEHVEHTPVSPASEVAQSGCSPSPVSPGLEKEQQSELSPAPPALEKEQSDHAPIPSAFEMKSDIMCTTSSHGSEDESHSDVELSPAPPALEKELQLDVVASPATGKEVQVHIENPPDSALSGKKPQTVPLVEPVSECSTLTTSVKELQPDVENTLASVLSTKENQIDIGNLLASLVSLVEKQSDCSTTPTSVKEQSVVKGIPSPELDSLEKTDQEKATASKKQPSDKGICHSPTKTVGTESANDLSLSKKHEKSEQSENTADAVSLSEMNRKCEAKSVGNKDVKGVDSLGICVNVAGHIVGNGDLLTSGSPKKSEDPSVGKACTENGEQLQSSITMPKDSTASCTNAASSTTLTVSSVKDPLPASTQSKLNESPVAATKKRRKFLSGDGPGVPLKSDSAHKPDAEKQPNSTEKSETKDLKQKSENKSALDHKDQAKSEDKSAPKVVATEVKDDQNRKKDTPARRSRFHSPSTKWSPKNDTRERKRSPSPYRGQEPPQKHRPRSRSRDRSVINKVSSPMLKSRPQNKDTRGDKNELFYKRKSRSRSKERVVAKIEPSPKRKPNFQNKESIVDKKEPGPKRLSRSRSKERVVERNEPWKDWNRGRRRSRSKSLPRSRSRSRSRTRVRKGLLDREEKETQPPLLPLPLHLPLPLPLPNPHQWDRWSNDNWRGSRGTRHGRNEFEYNEHFRNERDLSMHIEESYPPYEGRNEYPDWEMERRRPEDPRGREREQFRGSQWQENRFEAEDSWTSNFNSGWNANRHQGGRGRFVESFDYGHQSESRWECRQPLSENSNNSENEPAGFVDNRQYRHKNEREFLEAPPDRSGWTSASSWAVRKTLPADVQNYYSKRGRNASTPQTDWAEPEYTVAESGETAPKPDFTEHELDWNTKKSERTATKHEWKEPSQTEWEGPIQAEWKEPPAAERKEPPHAEWMEPPHAEWMEPPHAEWMEPPHAEWKEPPHAEWKGEPPHAEWKGEPPHAEWKGEPPQQAEWKGEPPQQAEWKGEPPPQAEWKGEPPPQAEWKGEQPPQAEWKGEQPPPRWNEPPPRWNEPPPRWNEPPPRWNEPPPRWNEPPPRWNEPPPRWNEPPSRWKEPPPQWKEPPPQWNERPPQWKEPPLEWKEPPPQWKEPPSEWPGPQPERTKADDQTPEQVDDHMKCVLEEAAMKDTKGREGKSSMKRGDVETNLEEQKHQQDDRSKINADMLPPPPPPPPQMNVKTPQMKSPLQPVQQISTSPQHKHQQISTPPQPMTQQISTPQSMPQQITPHHPNQSQISTPHQPMQQQIHSPLQPLQQHMHMPSQPMPQHMATPLHLMQQHMTNPLQPMNTPPPPIQQPMNMPPQAMQHHMNVPHQPMNIFPFPMGVPAPMLNVQHNPFNVPPPVPIHLHPGMPLIQVAAATAAAHELPPPPPPPPPPQSQTNYNSAQAAQMEGKKNLETIGQVRQITLTPVTTKEKVNPNVPVVSNNMLTLLLPASSAAVTSTGTVVGLNSSQASLSSHNRPSNTATTLTGKKVNSSSPHVSNTKSTSHLPVPAGAVGSKGIIRGPSSSNSSSASHSISTTTTTTTTTAATATGSKVTNTQPSSNNMKTSHLPPPAPPSRSMTLSQGSSSSNTSAPSQGKHPNITAAVSGHKVHPNAPTSNNTRVLNTPAPAGHIPKGAAMQGPNSSNSSLPIKPTTTTAASKMPVRKENVAVESRDDGYQVDKKVQIQERAAYEVKVAIKPYYQSKDITKDEYKEIVRKAVDKVCHSKSGDVNSAKVANLVRAYVDKYKHSRKEKYPE